MPEIAEVRVVAKALKQQILNNKISKIQIFYPKMIESDIKEFVNVITNNSIKDIKTIGKWLIFDLGEYSLLSHLRMEGKYFYVPSTLRKSFHTHVIFTFSNGMDLRYDDTRKFGKMLLVKTDNIMKTECIKKLGYEPEDERLTHDYLLEKFKNKRIPIKTLLLDQTIINGLGNIYANEVLFASQINPLRESRTITSEEAEKIITFSRQIITRSFELGGCTIRSYTSSLGVIGNYQNELKVHDRKDRPCPICQKPIECIKIGGRGTYYCSNCQK